MARLGVFCFPGTGHINPMTSLARRLQERGHEVVHFGIADVEELVRARGVEFHVIGQQDYPIGTLRKLDQHLGELTGLAAFRFIVERVRNMARIVFQDGPAAVRAEKVDALLIDEADMGGNVADYLGLPFLSIAVIPPHLDDDRVPPFYFGWNAGQDSISRLRNRVGILLLKRIASPIFTLINEQRSAWGLKTFGEPKDALSPLAQITQLPRALEFDIDGLPPLLHYAGPFLDAGQRPAVDFPWERLDGRPLVYASLGTLQNSSRELFGTIAAACADLHVQLVISLGGGLDPAEFLSLPGDPVVVGYAPQLELLKRARAVITHGGLNTVLEALNEGVPMVAIPLANDQPGVAARLAAHGAGIVVPPRKMSKSRLHKAMRAVLEEDRYRAAAEKLRDAIREVDGLEVAADAIEEALGIGGVGSAHPAVHVSAT